MMYTIHAPDYADGTYVLAEFDLGALYQQDKSPLEAGKVYPCPLCNGAPKVLQIDPEKCKGCGKCARSCPVEAITGEPKSPYTIDTEKCIRCKACVSGCKFDAIREV